MNKLHRKILKILSLIMVFGVITTNSYNVYGMVGDASGAGTSGGGTSGGMWINTVVGVRIAVVDQNGELIEGTRTWDYLRKANDGTSFKCKEGGTKLDYINDGICTRVASKNNTRSSKHEKIPDIFKDGGSKTLYDNLTGMSTDELKVFLSGEDGEKKLKYKLDDYIKNGNIKNHYLIVEPITLLYLDPIKGQVTGSYYGTYAELVFMLNRFGSNEPIARSEPLVAYRALPAAIFATGNNEIAGGGGYDKESGTYFGGKLNVVSSDWVPKNNGQISKHSNDLNYAWGIGIFWMPDIIGNNTCDFNNADHFSTETSGPNGEDCCSYVIDNLSTYGLTSIKQVYDKYPDCAREKSCGFDLNVSTATCDVNSTGEIYDIDNWECIYASAYSSDANIKNYFLKYGDANSECSVFCRDHVSYYYPGNTMKVLSGGKFTIGYNGTEIATYNAMLGPVKTVVQKQCSIFGTPNETCIEQANSQLNSIKAPSIEFAYESEYYNNPKVELVAEESDSNLKNEDNLYTRKVEYLYSLPDYTYEYVSKNAGISYENTSSIGSIPYITIGNHLPIHFVSKNDTVNYELTISKFNLPNFDKLVLGNQKMSTRFANNLETYVKTLNDSGYVTPVNINGSYYLDNTFIRLLEKNDYTARHLTNSVCGRTYNCQHNANGIICYNNGVNDENTYTLFKACIKNEANKINYEKQSYKNDMLYSCTFEVEAPFGGEGIDAIYRTISLNNPFPNIDGKGRNTGSNWCYEGNCDVTNQTVQTYITNNRGVETDEIYKELDPLYKITLTPSLIKKIRKYNDKNNYDDFTLKCKEGHQCTSTFIRNEFKDEFAGCGIDGKNAGLECNESDAWKNN